MKRPSRFAYAYAVGRVRALEKKLIPRAVFREAAGLDSGAVLRMMAEAGDYSGELTEVRNTRELDAFLAKQQEDLSDLAAKLLPEEDVLRALEPNLRLEASAAAVSDLPYPIIRDYQRRAVDCANIKIFMRASYLDLPVEILEKHLLGGGGLDRTVFLDGHGLSASEFAGRLPSGPLRNLWEKASAVLAERETFAELERGIADLLMSHLHEAKAVVFGPEPVFAYTLGRRRELDLVRLVGGGTINRIPADKIKERISATYV
ncbi:MAG: V-type ATPase subunit [Acidobacteriota bacterium]|nr:V-type ATPase subunit [Acidobacteriota bacterium]